MPQPKDDLIALSDIPTALALLTRLPIRADLEQAKARSHRAPWAYPLVGLVVGLIAVGLTYPLAGAGLPPALAAALLVAVQIILTGGLHEDGLADAADGLWGGWTPARRLEIMKDSQIGSYGTLALILSVLIRWQAIAILIAADQWGAVIVAAMASRAAMPVLMAFLPNARRAGLSHLQGRPAPATSGIAVGVALAVALPLLGIPSAITALIVGFAAALACLIIARAKIGGQTGDILGATQQVVEMALLCVLAAG